MATGSLEELASRMTQLTVSMPARNVAPWIGEALRSVLAERDVDLEVIVLDDASDDGTSEAVKGFRDDRVRLIRSAVRQGIGWCHNEIMRQSSSPYLAHVDADDWIRPGALGQMVRALEQSPDAAQAYADFLRADAGGTLLEPEAFQRELAAARRGPIDYRRQLIMYGMVVNHLRTYRRAALDGAGAFDELLPWGVDWEMALRLAERWTFVRVPDALYVKRILPGGASESVTLSGLRFWALRWRVARRRLKRDGHLLGLSACHVHSLLLAGLGDAIGVLPSVRRLLAPGATAPR
jgi:glycosyltransferase involved in cell wall biosynthesis